jgi:hypothetical protein
MRRAVAVAGITILISAVGSILASTAGARTTAPFRWAVKYTFGIPASKPDHVQCGEGTVLGFGDATSTFELTNVSGPIAGTTNCFLVTAEETITLTSDGSTLRLEEPGTACLPGNSIQAPFPLPVDAEGTFSVSHGTGVFRGAKGSGTFECTMAAGDQQHCTFSGTVMLP